MHWARGGDEGNAGHPVGELVVHTVAVESGKVHAGSVCQCRPAGGEGGGGRGAGGRHTPVQVCSSQEKGGINLRGIKRADRMKTTHFIRVGQR